MVLPIDSRWRVAMKNWWKKGTGERGSGPTTEGGSGGTLREKWARVRSRFTSRREAESAQGNAGIPAEADPNNLAAEKSEASQQLKVAQEKILAGEPAESIARHAMAALPDGPSDPDFAYAVAKRSFRSWANVDRRAEFGVCLLRLDRLYWKSMQEGDLKNALRVIKERVNLLDLRGERRGFVEPEEDYRRRNPTPGDLALDKLNSVQRERILIVLKKIFQEGPALLDEGERIQAEQEKLARKRKRANPKANPDPVGDGEGGVGRKVS